MAYDIYTNLQKPQPTPRTQAAINTGIAKAQAEADTRFQQKEYDRNGISRGRGTQAMAGIKSAQALSDGLARAYQVPMQDAVADAGNNLQYETQRENYGLGISGIAQQNDYANALAALQRQQAALNFTGNALGGLLGSIGNIGGGGNKGNWLDSFLGY